MRALCLVSACVLSSIGASACSISARPDAGADSPLGSDVPEVDAPPVDTGASVCGCTAGPHRDRIYVLSASSELYSFDPVTNTFEFVIGPVCAGLSRSFSMAVDPQGRAWILDLLSRRLQIFDILSPGACTDSGYLPTNPDFPLFGMGFSSPNADADCASLYVHSFSGGGRFGEGPGIGHVGILDGAGTMGGALAIRALAASNYDGAEMSGTGDGRVFAFGGVGPSKLAEIDRVTGAAIDVLPLTGLPRTNASAFAFFAGDFYFFTEALPDCDTCLARECGAAWTTCQADPECTDQVACAVEAGSVTDICGGGAGGEILDCLGRCGGECLTSSQGRVSQVTHLDWDRSDGPERALTVLADAPVRIVGAGTSPCVPTVPF